MKNKALLLPVGLCLALLCIAASIKYFTDYPNIANPPLSYAIPLDTGQHLSGQIPYNYMTLAQQIALFNLVNGTNFLATLNGNATNASLWGPTFFQEVDAQNFFPTNTFFGTNWPPPLSPTTFGQVWIGNSNGNIYHVNSKVNALTWTKTNLISSP